MCVNSKYFIFDRFRQYSLTKKLQYLQLTLWYVIFIINKTSSYLLSYDPYQKLSTPESVYNWSPYSLLVWFLDYCLYMLPVRASCSRGWEFPRHIPEITADCEFSSAFWAGKEWRTNSTDSKSDGANKEHWCWNYCTLHGNQKHPTNVTTGNN